MKHKISQKYKNIKCRECQIKYNRNTYFIRWQVTRDYTCENCLNVAYHQIKLDKLPIQEIPKQGDCELLDSCKIKESK